MKQKLMAMAVAGAFALPGIAMAQVTISGKLGAELNFHNINNAAAARLGGNTSETYVSDNTSIIRFGMQEKIGSDLTAFGLYEFRPAIDMGSRVGSSFSATTTTPIAYVGLRSSSWGELRAGSDTTWGGVGGGFSVTAGKHYSTSGALNYYSTGGNGVTSFSASRQTSLIKYTTPDFKNGFKVVAAWSSSPNAVDSDTAIGNTVRKGNAWYLMPEFAAGNWKVGFAHANIKTDAVAGAATNVKANKLYGEVKIAGFDVGLTMVQVNVDNAVTGAETVDTRTWLIPVRYRMGAHTFGGWYAKIGDNERVAADQGAKAMALAYSYALSRRTALGLTYAKVDNEANAGFDITSGATLANAGTDSSALAGETHSTISVSLSHSF